MHREEDNKKEKKTGRRKNNTVDFPQKFIHLKIFVCVLFFSCVLLTRRDSLCIFYSHYTVLVGGGGGDVVVVAVQVICICVNFTYNLIISIN